MNYNLEQYVVRLIRNTFFGIVTLLIPVSAHALALAEIELHSSLNQTLHATIPVSATQAELSLLEVSLASKKEFLRTDIQRLKILDSLVIELIKKDQAPYIKITSNILIREPLLEFILAIDSDKGRMLRSYTVFLSP